MLYFDESGYTGSDLRNSEQPYFTLASVRLTDDEVDSIKDSIAYAEWGGRASFYADVFKSSGEGDVKEDIRSSTDEFRSCTSFLCREEILYLC